MYVKAQNELNLFLKLDRLLCCSKTFTTIACMSLFYRYGASLLQQVKSVFWRSWITSIRDPLIVRIKFVQTIVRLNITKKNISPLWSIYPS